MIATTDTLRHQPTDYRLGLMLLWLVVSISSIVFIEPAPFDILIMALLAGFFLTGLRVPHEVNVAILLLGLFLLGNIVAGVLSPDPATAIKPVMIRFFMVSTWVLFVSVIVARPVSVMEVVWHGYLTAASLAAVWGALEYLGFLPESLGEAGMRAKGPFKDPNVYAPFLVPPTVYLAGKLSQVSGRTFVLYLALFFALVLGLLLGFSRGAWLNTALALPLFVVLSVMTAPSPRYRMRLLMLVGTLLVLSTMVVIWAVSQDVIGERFADRAVLVKEYDTEEDGRFDTQQEVLAEVGTNPVGIGPGRSSDVFGQEPHNIYLHVLVEAGWLGAFGFYGFIALTFVSSLPMLRERWALQTDFFVVFSCTLGTLAQSFFIDSTHWRHLYLLLAMLWGMIVAARRLRRPNGFT